MTEIESDIKRNSVRAIIEPSLLSVHGEPSQYWIRYVTIKCGEREQINEWYLASAHAGILMAQADKFLGKFM